MAKPPETAPPSPPPAGAKTPPAGVHILLGEPVTPGPEIVVEPMTPPPSTDPAAFIRTPPPRTGAHAMTDGGGRPELPAELARPSLPPPGPPVTGSTPSPVPSSWAAQPLTPMPEEATVPLPVDEVEFAEPEEDDISEVSIAPGPAPAAAASAENSGPRAGMANGGRVAPPPTPVGMLGSDGPRLPSPAGSDGAGGPGLRSARPMPMPPPAPLAEVPAKRPGVGGPSGVVPLLPPGATWSEALSQRPRKKRLKPWFEEVFDEDYLRTLPFMTPEQTLREVAFIKESLRAPPEAELLDVACGYGRHAIELGQGGYRVTGIDLSLPLLIRAADEAQRRSLSVNFVHADMREMAFESQFDGAFSFLTSFGYFDEETNLKVAQSIFRSLKPGGRFLLDTINRDYIVSDLPTRVWWEGDGCVVLEEVDFNFQTSRLTVRRSIVFQDGRQVEHDISIRAYSLHELARLVRQAGFRVVEISGGIATRGHFFSSTSRSVILLCERPAD
jgi:SAM-dependent methyltransferase